MKSIYYVKKEWRLFNGRWSFKRNIVQENLFCGKRKYFNTPRVVIYWCLNSSFLVSHVFRSDDDDDDVRRANTILRGIYSEESKSTHKACSRLSEPDLHVR